jgi:predicted DNA-binding transcriptional regulator YafY
MSNQLKRQIDILKILPRPGLGKSTTEIYELLQEQGYSTSKRSVERDLASLAETFPQAIHRREQQGLNGRTSYWHLTSLEGLLPETLINNNDAALALTLLKQQAYNRLPRGVFKRLDSLWEQASATAEQNRDAQQWMQLIQYLPDPMRPESPPINEQVQSAVEDALRDSDKLDLIIKTLDGETKLNGLLPLRMLLQEEILYLLAENPSAETMDDSIRLVPLHRILTAKSSLGLNDTSLEPDLAQQFALGIEGALRLVMRVKRPLAEALFNRPIGRDQKIEQAKGESDWFIVTTDIDNSPQLRRWLARRDGSELEILESGGLL